MLKRLVNEARFTITFTATGPLLIKSGHPTLIGPDMTPVLTRRNGEEQVYLPGSSLKGTFRSHIERVIRTLRPDEVVVADPFKSENAPDQSCGSWFEQRKKNDEAITTEVVYRDSDPVARLFGSHFCIGRVSIGDAYLVDATTGDYLQDTTRDKRLPTEQRDGVGIDRLTGGAYPRAKFELEVVAAGTIFRSEVLLRNFECWQLGAVLLVVQDMADELVRIGSGKSRGLGAVKAAVDTIAIHHIGKTANRAPTEIWGLGHVLGASSRYGTWSDDLLHLNHAPDVQHQGIRQVQRFQNNPKNKVNDLTELMDQAVQDFVQRMEAFPAYKQPRGRTL
jgi:CRISPR-associated RAMP protein (TIGR02581 family)